MPTTRLCSLRALSNVPNRRFLLDSSQLQLFLVLKKNRNCLNFCSHWVTGNAKVKVCLQQLNDDGTLTNPGEYFACQEAQPENSFYLTDPGLPQAENFNVSLTGSKLQ